MKKTPSPNGSNPLSLGDARPMLVRIGGALAIALGFLLVTSHVDPGSTRATAPDNEISPTVTGADSPGASLGTLEGRDYTVRLVSTPDGPRYTVVNHFGAILAAGLTQQEVYDRFAGLTLDRMISSPVMMVDTDD